MRASIAEPLLYLNRDWAWFQSHEYVFLQRIYATICFAEKIGIPRRKGLSIDRTLGTKNSAGRSRPHENEAYENASVGTSRRVITPRAL